MFLKLWYDKDVEPDWHTVLLSHLHCKHSLDSSLWTDSLIPVRGCLGSNPIKLLDAVPGHNVWLMFIRQTCSLLHSCAHTARCSSVSTAGHDHYNIWSRCDEGRGISAGSINHQDLWMTIYHTQRGQRETEHVVLFGKFELFMKLLLQANSKRYLQDFQNLIQI